MTHNDLVKRAGKWLRNSLHCGVVLEELKNQGSWEIPDAVGWCGQQCILIECKTSLSDFRADLKKASRNGAPTVGAWRFYLALPDIVPAEELPDGWGLYEVSGRSVHHKAGPEYRNMGNTPFESDKGMESAMLLSVIRRLQISSCVYVQPLIDSTGGEG